MADNLNFKGYDQILSDMLADFAAKGTNLSDMNPGSITLTIMEVLAARLDEGHYQAEQILNLFFVATTSGKYLDRRVAERGTTRKPGTKASGAVNASRSTPAPFGQLVEKGAAFETEDHAVQIVTTADATLDQGTTGVVIPAEAADVGKAGNLVAGTVLKQVGVAISLIEAVTVAAPGLAGGADEETDEELRSRYLAVVGAPGTSGNKADYIKWAMEVAGVGGVYVLPLWNGHGTVKLFFLGTDKTPASQAVVDAAQVYIDPDPGMGEGKAPIDAVVTCVTAPAAAINVSASVALDGTKTLAEVSSTFEADLVEYLKEIAYSQDTTARYTYIGALLHGVQGVTDYSNLLVNGGTANITVNPGAVAVKGTVTLT